MNLSSNVNIPNFKPEDEIYAQVCATIVQAEVSIINAKIEAFEADWKIYMTKLADQIQADELYLKIYTDKLEALNNLG